MNMEPLEIFTVYSAVETEAAVYRDITADVLSDLRLASAVGRIRIEIYPAKSLYLMAALLRDAEMPIHISDMAAVETSYENGEDYVKITIDREKYMPDLTRYLWAKYTPANVIQNDRWTILVRTTDPKKEAAELPLQIIANPSKNLHADMIEFSVRAVPEGFRVRYHTFENNEFMFIASEDIIEPNQSEHAKKMMANLRDAVPDPAETKKIIENDGRGARRRAENAEEEH